MNNLSTDQVAWLAGIYEGEGSCAITKGRAIRVEIIMTDRDVIERIAHLTGLGSVKEQTPRQEQHKPSYRWSVGSGQAALFLEAILPWLGERRSYRAQAAISNWMLNRRQTGKWDTHCTNGHELTPDNTYETYGGNGRGCRTCRLEYTRRYREKNREKIRANAHRRYLESKGKN